MGETKFSEAIQSENREFLMSKYFLGWTLYFVSLFCIGFFLENIPLDVWKLSLLEAAKFTGYGDPNSFAAAATDISIYGWVTEKTHAFMNLWPPGYMIFEGVLLKIFGSTAPMGLILLASSSALFSTVMMEIRRIMSLKFGNFSWFLPFFIFVFPTSRFFLLNIYGLLFGEWLAVGCFFAAILLLLRRTTRAILLAGCLFAAAAYTRSQYEFFLSVILGILIGVKLVTYFLKNYRHQLKFLTSDYLLKAMVVAQILMAPWRLFHFSHNGDFKWVYTFDSIVAISLKTDEMLNAEGLNWMLQGGVNVPCHLAPQHCGIHNPEIYWQIFKNNPVKWISMKLELLPRYWFTASNSVASPAAATYSSNGFSLIMLSCLLATFYFLWRARNREEFSVWFMVTSGLIIAHFGIVAFSHLEVRYLYFIKIYGIFAFMMLLFDLSVKKDQI